MIWEHMLGRTFWGMVGRFTLFPVALSLIAVPFQQATTSLTTEWTLAQRAWIWAFYIVSFSWVGWGLAHWRFSEEEIPVQSFAAYPLISGLIVVPVFLVLLSTASEPETAEFAAVAVFGAITGPVCGLLVAGFWKHAPQLTALRK